MLICRQEVFFLVFVAGTALKFQNLQHFIPPGTEGHNIFKWPSYCRFNSTSSEECPKRLQKDASVVLQANGYHFAMIQDTARNEFYHRTMQNTVRGKKVLVIGSGSGILDIIAAKQGAAHVDGVEASEDLQKVATRNVEKNGLAQSITIHHTLSTDFSYPSDEDKADMLVAEILGDTLLGEGALEYVADARKRLLKPGAPMIPSGGAQMVTMVQSPELWHMHTVNGWNGIDLSAMNTFTDSFSIFNRVFDTGLSDSHFKPMSPQAVLFQVDFMADKPVSTKEGSVRLVAKESGPIHALLLTWEAYGEPARKNVLNTHLSSTGRGQESEWQLLRRKSWRMCYKLVTEEVNPEDPEALPKEFLAQAGEEFFVDFGMDGDDLTYMKLRRASSAPTVHQSLAP
eukprot:gnl/TRDRNA2_/TRDRNA2_186322_c0_seq1.p1 gnl/TRDRNA2_/TRDRNA2_186322_c0~~gnl/TRDRNA2_/TRDRNA2_186322_c0_seq1.p1  ORF type:complete len:399 (-),score=78.98 gnl/TRDRNA2_/TRDRNA2_186322_c0_seq1:58-1254(-)